MWGGDVLTLSVYPEPSAFPECVDLVFAGLLLAQACTKKVQSRKEGGPAREGTERSAQSMHRAGPRTRDTRSHVHSSAANFGIRMTNPIASSCSSRSKVL